MTSELSLRIASFIPVVLSLTVHEWAHARAAWELGDDTAERLGRLTLNPLSHLDPIGTLLPLIGIPFGWAKPVPVDPNRFSQRVSLATGMVLTAAAGPLANFALAVTCLVLLAFGSRVAPDLVGARHLSPEDLARGLAARAHAEAPAFGLLLRQGVIVNLALGIFNLLPIPPLDGSRIVDGLLPFRWRSGWNRFTAYGSPVLLVVIVGLAAVGVNGFGWVAELGTWLVQRAAS